jgi:hypothetical protein
MMRPPAGIKPGFIHIRAFMADSSAISAFLARPVERNKAVIARLDRATQYSRALAIDRKATANGQGWSSASRVLKPSSSHP